MNMPDWDILYVPEYTGSDSFQLDHKRYYEPYLNEFEAGMARKNFLHDWVYQIEQLEKLERESKINAAKRKARKRPNAQKCISNMTEGSIYYSPVAR